MDIKEQIIKRVHNIPPLPQAATMLMAVLNKKNHNLQDIIRVVETDSALTASLLKTINSGAYGMKRKISSLHMAVSLLGERNVLSVAIKTCGELVFNSPLEGYGALQGELWTHSLFTAIAAREVAKITGVSEEDFNIAYTAGLLHDIGKIVLSIFMKDETYKLLQYIDKNAVADYREAERKFLGTDHTVVGKLLAEHWNIPEKLCNIILYHHNPSQTSDEDKLLTFSVHMGDIMAMMSGYGTGADAMRYEFDPETQNYISLSHSQQELLLFEVQMQFSNIHKMLSGEQ